MGHVMPNTGMQKPMTNIWMAMIEVENCHALCTGMSRIYMGGQCHKTCP